MFVLQTGQITVATGIMVEDFSGLGLKIFCENMEKGIYVVLGIGIWLWFRPYFKGGKKRSNDMEPGKSHPDLLTENMLWTEDPLFFMRVH
jgi:hypothetical protein